MATFLRFSVFFAFRQVSSRGMLAVALIGSLLIATGCDFDVSVTVRNRSADSIMVEVNGQGKPGVVESGKDGHFWTSINENLRTIRITSPTDPSVNIVKTFTRNRGYNVFVTVTGPPIEVTVETRSFGKATPADATAAN